MSDNTRNVLRDAMLSAAECDSWLTLDELEKLTVCPWSVLLKHLVALRDDGYIVERRMRDDRTFRLEYRLRKKPTAKPRGVR